MKISRRRFLGSAIGSAAGLSLHTSAWGKVSLDGQSELGCAVLDLKTECVLRESLDGYRAALAIDDHQILDMAADAQYHCRMIIIPGAGAISDASAQMLSHWLTRGGLILLESGAGFLSPADFAVHQNSLWRYFSVAIEPAINLWPAGLVDARFSARTAQWEPLLHNGVPYVNYVWPGEAIIRDYSRVIPVSEGSGEIIGRAQGVPVALKRHIGNGFIVFLGSPMGPALAAGDREAHSWLSWLAAAPGEIRVPDTVIGGDHNGSTNPLNSSSTKRGMLA